MLIAYTSGTYLLICLWCAVAQRMLHFQNIMNQQDIKALENALESLRLCSATIEGILAKEQSRFSNESNSVIGDEREHEDSGKTKPEAVDVLKEFLAKVKYTLPSCQNGVKSIFGFGQLVTADNVTEYKRGFRPRRFGKPFVGYVVRETNDYVFFLLKHDLERKNYKNYNIVQKSKLYVNKVE